MKAIPCALAAGALFAAVPASAQGRDEFLNPNDMKRVRPVSCAVADSLAGRPLARPRQIAIGWHEGSVNNFVSNDPFAITGFRPIDAIILTATSDGPGPHPDAIYALQLRLKDTVLREGEAAALVIVLDDTLRTEIGDMIGTATPFGHGNTIDQMLTQMLPNGVVRQMIVAGKVGGSIGPTPFVVPPRTLEMFRSVFIAASCGEKV